VLRTVPSTGDRSKVEGAYQFDAERSDTQLGQVPVVPVLAALDQPIGRKPSTSPSGGLVLEAVVRFKPTSEYPSRRVRRCKHVENVSGG
jgi:hypothetical protein